MTKKPELSDYSLDYKMVNTVNSINSSVQEKKGSLKNIVLCLTFIFGIVLFYFSFPLIKKLPLLLILIDIVVIVLFYNMAVMSDLFTSSMKRHLDKQLHIHNVTLNQFELWDINNSKYNSEFYAYERKYGSLKTSYHYPNYNKTHNSKDKKETTESIFPKSTANLTNNHSDTVENNTEKRPNQIVVQEKPIEIKKEDPEKYLINPFGTLFQFNNSQINPSDVKSSENSNGRAINHTIDELLLAEKRQIIGESGELFILEYERKKLIKYNLEHLLNQIEHSSKVQGDRIGYDITSFNQSGQRIFIEVKTSIGGLNTPFFLTDNEYETRKKNENYFIYRVFDFSLYDNDGKLYIINPGQDLETFFKIETKVYKFTPNKADKDN